MFSQQNTIIREVVLDFVKQFEDKDDSYEIWGQAERPENVIQLGTLRALVGIHN